MSNWKDDLKKIKPRLSSASEKSRSKSEEKAARTDAADEAWKEGVKPLKRQLYVARKTSAKERCVDGGNVRETELMQPTRQNIPKKKKKTVARRGSKGDASIRGKGTFRSSFPSDEAIRDAYGGNRKTRLKKVPVKPVVRDLPACEALQKVVLSSGSEYKDPDHWVDAGSGLQAPGGGTGRVLSIRMGIDFGTCYTKVALKAAGKVFFIDWDGLRNCEAQRYFLPGELSRCVDGYTRIGRAGDALEVCGGLKEPFLSKRYDESQDSSASTAFIAWVMRYARAWMYRHQESLVKDRRLAWEVNIGSPTDPWCSTNLQEHYRKMGLLAWRLSKQISGVELQLAHTVQNLDHDDPALIGLDDLNVVPEFSAQVAGYVKSAQRKDGLHLLVDVGGGTMDVVAFNIYHKPRSDEDRLPIFEGVVAPLGTHWLMAERLRTLPTAERTWADHGGIPNTEKLSRDYGIDMKLIEQADEEFTSRIERAVGKILHRTKSTRYPRAPEWKDGMRVFLAGGGSACKVYAEGVSRAFRNVGTQPLFTTFPMLEEAAKNVGKKAFHRVSVAFGLTYGADSIGRTVRPQEIEDITPTKGRSVERPDRDELYPK